MFNNSARPSKYVSVPQVDKGNDDLEELLKQHTERHSTCGVSATRNLVVHHWFYFTHSILSLFCVVFFGLWIQARTLTQMSDSLPYSPANVAVEYQKEWTVFNGTFNHHSIYRGRPTQELDVAWHNISKGVKLARLSQQEILKIGKEDTSSKVKYRDEDGGGYMAALEVTHQLHCLNVLRKYIYFDHYGKVDPFFTESNAETYRMHLEHCIDNLRQVLMCSADAAMITFEWVRGFSSPYPDFNTRHQCRNFEKLTTWQNANGIHGIPSSHITRLEGNLDLDYPP